ncbi:MAG: hypothetical protein IPJ76_05245 [Flavobacteriales bacterium]|nr:MAG: hypothetical protein IPJ76_05245 [Flavobacteriales bacterium]
MVRSLRFWAIVLLVGLASLTVCVRVFHALAVDSAFDIPIHDEYRVEVFIMGWLVLLLPLLLAGLYLMIPSLVSGRTGRWLSAANVLLTALGILAAVAPLWSNWLMFKELSTQGYYGSRMLIEDLSSQFIANLYSMSPWLIALGQVCFVVNAVRVARDRRAP